MKALVVENLTKQYPNGITALKGINLQVDEGDFFALLGQNGAGKSTTIGIVSSLVKKTAGRVAVFGYDIDTAAPEAKSLIGIVPQEMNFGLFEKVAHILINQAGYYGIPKKTAIRRMDYYLSAMGIAHTQHLPAFRLSGGMKRRLMIARALMNEPKLLILDEPTAGVDIELRHTLWQFLTELNERGSTIILTTHYLEEAEKLCKNVAIIDHGEIIEHENMKSLINRLQSQTIIFDIEGSVTDDLQLNDFLYQIIDDTTLEVEIRRGQMINDLFALLTQQNIQITSMRNKTNRLEELYLDLVTKNKKP